MTRRSDLMLEDLFGCEHEPTIAICDDGGGEILFWRCACGARRVQPKQPAQPEQETKSGDRGEGGSGG